MLPQQVGFVCAVLALVCCASGLFGSLGRCRCGPVPPGVGVLGWKPPGSSEMSPFPSASGWSQGFLQSPPHPAGRAHPGGLTATL